MAKKPWRFRLLAVSIVFEASLRCAFAICPACYNDSTPMAGHGTSADGRKIINVYIDNSWDDTPGHTNVAIWNAVLNGITKWNNATDGSGNHIPYYFQINQAAPQAAIDMKFSKGTLIGATAETDLNHTPSMTTLNYALADTSVVSTDSAGGTVAHEIGHRLGLGDANSFSGCAAATSIMREANSNETVKVAGVQQSDVAQALTAANNPSQCGYTKENPNLQDAQADSPDSPCDGETPDNYTCSCNSTSGFYDCECFGLPDTCDDGTPQECDGGQWSCPTVSTAQCDNSPPCTGATCIATNTWDSSTCSVSCTTASPCDGATCVGNNVWDTSQCTSVNTNQCDGSAPCDGATCVGNNVWDTSQCSNNSCSDYCDPDCTAYYDPCACYGGDYCGNNGDGSGDGGGGGGGGGDDGNYCTDDGGQTYCDDCYDYEDCQPWIGQNILAPLVPIGIALACVLPFALDIRRKRPGVEMQ